MNEYGQYAAVHNNFRVYNNQLNYVGLLYYGHFSFI